MKTTAPICLFIIILLCCTPRLFSQTLSCDSRHLAYHAAGITLDTADFNVWGDSLLVVPLINQSDTFSAYPMAKLIPVTAMPANVSFHNNGSVWQVFASAWLPGDTMPCKFYFDITGPVPANAPVTFQLWLANLRPLDDDSCQFDKNFTVDFNSGQVTGLVNAPAAPAFNVLTYATEKQIEIRAEEWDAGYTMHVADISGRLLKQEKLNGPQQTINLNTLAGGLYFVYVTGGKGMVFSQKIWLPQ